MNIDNIQEHIRNTHYYHYQTTEQPMFFLDTGCLILVFLSDPCLSVCQSVMLRSLKSKTV